MSVTQKKAKKPVTLITGYPGSQEKREAGKRSMELTLLSMKSGSLLIMKPL